MVVDFSIVDSAITNNPEWTNEEIDNIYYLISRAIDKDLNIELRYEAAIEVNDFVEATVVDLTKNSPN